MRPSLSARVPRGDFWHGVQPTAVRPASVRGDHRGQRHPAVAHDEPQAAVSERDPQLDRCLPVSERVRDELAEDDLGLPRCGETAPPPSKRPQVDPSLARSPDGIGEDERGGVIVLASQLGHGFGEIDWAVPARHIGVRDLAHRGVDRHRALVVHDGECPRRRGPQAVEDLACARRGERDADDDEVEAAPP